MPTPALSTAFAVRGQAFNLSGVLRSQTTGNPITTGLAGLTAWVSKDDGMFAAATNAPVERNSSGWVSLDLTAAEMTAWKIDVMFVANGAVTDCRLIAPLDLSGSYTTTYLGQTIVRFEQMLKNSWQYLFNRNIKAGAQQVLRNDDGIPMASAVIVEGDGEADKGAMR